MRTPTSRWAALLAGLTVVALAFPVSLGHTGPRRQKHRRVVRPTEAVIVVGRERPLDQIVIRNGRPYGVLDVNVKPRTTEVWVNGEFRGTAAAFDGRPGKLWLLPGKQTIRLVTPGGIEVIRDVRIKAGVEMNLALDLRH